MGKRMGMGRERGNGDTSEALYIIHDRSRRGRDLDETLMDSNEKKGRKENHKNT